MAGLRARASSTPQSLASTRRAEVAEVGGALGEQRVVQRLRCAASSTTRLQAASALSPRFRRSCTCSASSGSSSISRWVTKISRIAFTVLRSTRPTISSSTARLAPQQQACLGPGDSPRGWNSKRCATWTCVPDHWRCPARDCRGAAARSGAGGHPSASPTASGKASASVRPPSPSSRTAASKAGSASSAIAGSALNSSVWPRRARAGSLLRLFAETGPRCRPGVPGSRRRSPWPAAPAPAPGGHAGHAGWPGPLARWASPAAARHRAPRVRCRAAGGAHQLGATPFQQQVAQAARAAPGALRPGWPGRTAPVTSCPWCATVAPE